MTWRLASLLGRHGGDYGTKDIQVLHYVIWPWRRILNGACISISNLPENIAWQTHKDDLRPKAWGPLKSGAWGCRPTCHPQTSPLHQAMYLHTYLPIHSSTFYTTLHVNNSLTIMFSACIWQYRTVHSTGIHSSVMKVTMLKTSPLQMIPLAIWQEKVLCI